ncbi:MAG: hypothetical protein ACRDUY_02640, partial [Nitriliruptorales bacterium]
MADTRLCPLCASDVPWPWPRHCPYCAAPLGADVARELAELDDRIAVLGEQRQRLLAALREGRPVEAAPLPSARAHGRSGEGEGEAHGPDAAALTSGAGPAGPASHATARAPGA